MAKAKALLPERKDPKPRLIDAVLAWSTLKNQDPGLVYVWVYKGSSTAIVRYRALGYEEVTYTPNGVRPVAAPRNLESQYGQVIEVMDQVLMAVPKEIHDQLRAEEQEEADRYEKRIINGKDSDWDPMRGFGAPRGHFSVQRHQTSDGHEHGELIDE